MNRSQGICLWAGITLFVLMGLFPPWHHTRNTWSDYHYSFLWDPPMVGDYDSKTGRWKEALRPDWRYQLSR